MDAKIKDTSSFFSWTYPNFAPVIFYYFLGYSQSNSRASVLFLTMQALEQDENPIEKFRVDAKSIIANRKLPVGFGFGASNLDYWI